MKKLVATLSLISLSILSYAQGTIAFGNSALTRVIVCTDVNNPPYQMTEDGIVVSVWFGPAGSSRDALVQAPGTATIGTTAGVLTGAPSVFALPGTEPNQVVSLQIRGTGNSGRYGETKIAQVTLGPTAGPGTVIWQTASGMIPNRFTPLIICPEPSTLVLGAVSGLALLFRIRKSAWKCN